MVSQTQLRAVIVTPSYRLNAFGFLASSAFCAVDPEIASNVGFWDQRLALEWTATHIGDYGGNPANITVGGLSAGAYSTFHQLAYETLRLPRDQQLIKRIVMWSNGCGLPPKTEVEVRSHVEMLLSALAIPTDLEPKEQLARLRSVPAQNMAAAVEGLPENAFRVVVNTGEADPFVGTALFTDLQSGKLAKLLKDKGTRIMCGEVKDEFQSYRLNSPPGSYRGLVQRLAVEYPEALAERMSALYCGRGAGSTDGSPSPTVFPSASPTLAIPPCTQSPWQDLFGTVYADMQVHVSQRGLLSNLHPIVPASHIYRYQIRWRPQCVDAVMPRHMKVAHGSDLSLWWFGNGWSAAPTPSGSESKSETKAKATGLLPSEQPTALALIRPFAAFLNGDSDLAWGTTDIAQLKVVHDDGVSVNVLPDERWEEGVRVWRDIVNPAPRAAASRL